MLTFFALTPGMHVADLGAGGGYTTELIARSVGPSGAVFAQDTRELGRGRAQQGLDSATRATGAGEHEALHAPVDDPLPPEAKSLDEVTFVCAYHDVVAEKSDPNKLNQAVFARTQEWRDVHRDRQQREGR